MICKRASYDAQISLCLRQSENVDTKSCKDPKFLEKLKLSSKPMLWRFLSYLMQGEINLEPREITLSD